MKIAAIPALLFLYAGLAGAADVRLAALGEFDAQQHRIGVNVHEDVPGNCRLGSDYVTSVFGGLLSVMGFQQAEVADSHLEFAVSLQGIPMQESCGVRLLSMVRQVPEMKILRISPGSTSRQYRLWTSENLLTGSRDEVRRKLEEQATQDIIAFRKALQAAGE